MLDPLTSGYVSGPQFERLPHGKTVEAVHEGGADSGIELFSNYCRRVIVLALVIPNMSLLVTLKLFVSPKHLENYPLVFILDITVVDLIALSPKA